MSEFDLENIEIRPISADDEIDTGELVLTTAIDQSELLGLGYALVVTRLNNGAINVTASQADDELFTENAELVPVEHIHGLPESGIITLTSADVGEIHQFSVTGKRRWSRLALQADGNVPASSEAGAIAVIYHKRAPVTF